MDKHKRKTLNRVLFVYPNSGALRIPLAIAILSSKLKDLEIEVHVFDTTFFRIEETSDYALMESRRVVKETHLDYLIGDLREVNISEEIKTTVSNFKPDVILFSVLERHYWLFDILARSCKGAEPETPIIVGGILATIYPGILLQHPCVDYVVYGEGEEFIENMVKYFGDADKFQQIPNLMFRDNSCNEIKNSLGNLTDMNAVPFQDWNGFDIRQLLKPYEGIVWIGGSFEFSRGCHKLCSFCVAPQLRGSYGKEMARKYHRTKSPEYAIAEIKEKKERYNLTFLAMCDTDFLLGVPEDIIDEFCRLYKKEVGIPWIIQSSAESFTEKKLAAIVDAGCISASIGVESGSTRIRKEVLKKYVSLERIKKTFDLCRDYNFRTTANYMVGLPYETEEDINKTIEFNRLINPPSVAITYFTPFLGTELYDLCVKEGFYPGFDPHQNVYKYSPLKMPQLSRKRIEESTKMFMNAFEEYKQNIDNIPDEITKWNNEVVAQIFAPKNLKSYSTKDNTSALSG